MSIIRLLVVVIIFVLSISNVDAAYCNTSAECSYNGLCAVDRCRCFNGYVKHDSELGCNYRQKSRLTAFMLEFLFGGLGAGWFYLNRLEFAIPALVMLVFVCCAKPCLMLCEENENRTIGVGTLTVVFILFIVGLWLHGVITMGMGTATDSNGVVVGDW